MAVGNLVIGRGVGRAVYIGRGVTVTVVDVRGDGQVELAFEAPQGIAISRDDYPMIVHLEHQSAREKGQRITDEEAYRRAGVRR